MESNAPWVVVLLALLTSAPAIILAMARLIDSLRNQKRLEDLDQRVNGRMDQLLGEREARARLEGYVEGRAARRKTDPPVDPAANNS